MTPLRLEAVYERVPLSGPAGPLGEAAVRWGVRASYGRDGVPAGDAEFEAARRTASADAQRAGAQRAGAQRAGAARGPRRGPHEAPAVDPEPFPELLAYGPNGGAIPLMPAGAHPTLRGTSLDLYA